MAKTDPEAARRQRHKTIRWVVTVFLITVVISGIISLVSDEVMDKCDVFLTPGGIFGSEGNRYIRITLCCPEELLKKATDKIKIAFGK